MGVVNLLSQTLTDLAAKPPQLQLPQFIHGKLDDSVALVTKAAGNDASSVYRFHRIRSDAVIAYLGFHYAAWGANALADVGIYQTAENGGAVVDVDMFVDALDVAAAVTAPVDITCRAQGVDYYLMPLWQRLALSADPRREYDICITAEHIGASQNAKNALILRTRQ